MTFSQRLINVTFQLASGTFAESGTDTVKLTGLRVSAHIQKAGGPSKNTSEIVIYGMPLSLMNQLSTLGMIVRLIPRNTITVEAGDASKMTTVFTGTIFTAAADFGNSPQSLFRVQAQTGLAEAIISIPATSYTGRTGISTIMAQLAKAMKLPNGFENNLPNEVFLNNPYLPGTAWEQMKRAARAAGVGADVDDGTLVLYPLDGPRLGPMPLVSPSTGMIDYPTYISQGIMVRTEYNPAIRFRSLIQVAGSIVTAANGTWLVAGLDHNLDAFMPNGQWSSMMQCYNPIFPTPVVQ